MRRPLELVAACELQCSFVTNRGGRCPRQAIGAEGIRSHCVYHTPEIAAASRKATTARLADLGLAKAQMFERGRLGSGNSSGMGPFQGETRKASKMPKRGQR